MPNVVEVTVRTRDEASKGLKDATKNVNLLRTSMLALSPAAIPALGGIAAGAGLVATSLGGAMVTTGAFGALAKTVLTKAGADATNLATLQTKLADATTAKQKKSIDQQIANLERGWGASYTSLVQTTGKIQNQWQTTAKAIATPVLVPWMDAVSAALTHLKPLVQPVADLFKYWGQQIDTYFRSRAGSEELNRMATALGQFGANQLDNIVIFFENVAKGVATLGKDLASHNVDFGAFGYALARWGVAFNDWSKSDKARQDVSKFLVYLHQNGGLVKQILGDIAKVLPNLFSGLSGAGSTDLKLITGFFNLIAGLPPWFQKWVAQGLPLFLIGSKVLPVIAAAQKLVAAVSALQAGGAVKTAAGGAAGGAAAGAGENAASGGVAGAIAAAAGPAMIVAGTVAAGLFIKGFGDALSPKGSAAGKLNQALQSMGSGMSTTLLHSFTFGGIEAWMADKFGIPVGRALNNVIDGAKIWAKNIESTITGAWSDVEGGAKQWGKNIGQEVSSTWSNIEGGAKLWAKNIGSSVSGAWSAVENGAKLWARNIGSTVSGAWSAIEGGAKLWARNIESSVSGAWNTALSTTKTVAGNIVSWVSGLPGKFVSALKSLPGDLRGLASIAFTDLLNGFKAIATGPNGILTWLDGFVKSIIGKIKSILGIHSPSSVFYDIGKNMMLGLKAGIQDHAHQAANAAVSKAQAKAQASHSSGGPGGGSEAANAKLAQKLYPAWGKGAEWQAWNAIAMAESGWNSTIMNAASGAFGIAQALGHGVPGGGGKYGNQYGGYGLSLAGDRAANNGQPNAQITWMHNYIASAYGDPIKAWAFHRANNYYAAGGPTSAGWAMVGERGRELVKLPGGATVYPHGASAQMVSGNAGGWAPLIHLEISSGGQSAFEQFMLKALREWVRVKGGGSVQKALGYGPG